MAATTTTHDAIEDDLYQALMRPGTDALDEVRALLAPLRAGWRQQAACRGHEQEIFFPERGASTSEAKAVCARCPVRLDCLE